MELGLFWSVVEAGGAEGNVDEGANEEATEFEGADGHGIEEAGKENTEEN